jgi:hypothetical protein
MGAYEVNPTKLDIKLMSTLLVSDLPLSTNEGF